MKNIHNQNVAELAHYIIVFYTQELDTCSGDTGILIWHLLYLDLLRQSLLHLNLALEKRIHLVLSSPK